jgi:hypothetical protein
MVWPSISLDTANRLYLWGWYGSLFGAAVTALSVCILMLGTRVRDRDAESQMTKANTAAAEANVRAGKLELQAAELNKEAADAKLEQERLKAQLAWRVIPPETLAKLRERLRQLDGSVLFAFPSSDNEAQYLAIQLAKSFENTNWKLGAQSRTYANAVIFGIVIPGPVTQDVLKVREAFSAAGIPFSTHDLTGRIYRQWRHGRPVGNCFRRLQAAARGPISDLLGRFASQLRLRKAIVDPHSRLGLCFFSHAIAAA